MELTVNGEHLTVEPREDESLLEVLRERVGIRSTKDGCAPEGSCGACTVLVGGRAVVSCAQKASRMAGKEVVTQEGLDDETRRRWAECFLAAGASRRRALLAAAALGGATIIGVALTDGIQALTHHGLALSAGVTLYVAASNLVPEFQAKHDWRLPISFFVGSALFFLARAIGP